VINYNLIEILNIKKAMSINDIFLKWIKSTISGLESRTKLKIK
jgi:hypothetical protein